MSALLGRLPVGCLAGPAARGSPPRPPLPERLLRAGGQTDAKAPRRELRPGRRAWPSRWPAAPARAGRPGQRRGGRRIVPGVIALHHRGDPAHRRRPSRRPL